MQSSLRALMTAAICALGSLAHSQTPTGPDVLERCKRSYEGLQSYDGVTRVTGHSSTGGQRRDYNVSARIRYAAPGRIRVEGSLMDAGTYQYLSDGRQTWSMVSYNR